LLVVDDDDDDDDDDVIAVQQASNNAIPNNFCKMTFRKAVSGLDDRPAAALRIGYFFLY